MSPGGFLRGERCRRGVPRSPSYDLRRAKGGGEIFDPLPLGSPTPGVQLELPANISLSLKRIRCGLYPFCTDSGRVCKIAVMFNRNQTTVHACCFRLEIVCINPNEIRPLHDSVFAVFAETKHDAKRSIFYKRVWVCLHCRSMRGSRFSANAETTASAVEGILDANGGVIFDAIRT